MDDTDLLKAIYASATDHAIVTMDNSGVVTSWNPGAERILGFKKDEIIGRSGKTFFTNEDIQLLAPEREFDAAMKTGRGADDRWHVRKDGSRFWGEGVVTPIWDAYGAHRGFLKVMRDMTDKKRMEDELIRIAHFDSITGLPNRSHFETRLAELVAATARAHRLLILHIVDLDYFKQVNDSLGHHAGDRILHDAARRMSSLLRGTDFIARMGGDEFAVLQALVDSPNAGVVLAEKLLRVLSTPFAIDGREVRIGASIGIAVCPQDAAAPDRLLEKADLALYRVKRTGRGGFSYFAEDTDAEARERTRILPELRRAVEQRAFYLEYQPQIDCHTGKIASLEALLRCSYASLAGYSTETLVDIAADAGLMPAISQWVIDEVSIQQREWQDAGFSRMRVSVNLCPRELITGAVTEQIKEKFQTSILQPVDLEIEITEREIFETRERGIQVLSDLRALGVSVALDDFGRGNSSLSCLRSLPLDRLKLDREFLTDIPHDKVSRTIAESVITMAHAINLEVIAEGVESAEQAEFFRDRHCDALQGFYFSRPLSAKDITQLLLKSERNPLWTRAIEQKGKEKPVISPRF